MNKKREAFLATFATQVKGICTKKNEEESKNKKLPISRYIDGYKNYVLDLGEGFIQFAEAYNQCIDFAHYNEIIGKSELKVRIKDFSSSLTNTELKSLDDIFGMQINTVTEKDKEFLILFNYLIFEVQKCKKYNKSNGYAAYHHIGNFSHKDIKNINEIKKAIKDIVKNSKTREYKSEKSAHSYDANKMPYVFAHLADEIKNPSKLNRMAETLQEMLQLMQYAELEPSKIPLIDFHFMTFDAEEKAIRGTASHDKYKKEQRELIRQFFNNGRLYRGINSPWKFIGKKNGLVLQDFYDTVIENWPFLLDDIIERRKKGKESEDILRNEKFDILLASQFPFLRGYLRKQESYPESEQAEKLGMLKAIMTVNRIDFNGELVTIEEVLMENINNIWR